MIQNAGSVIAILAIGGFAVLVLFGLYCDLRRWVKHRRDEQRLVLFISLEQSYDLPPAERRYS